MFASKGSGKSEKIMTQSFGQTFKVDINENSN